MTRTLLIGAAVFAGLLILWNLMRRATVPAYYPPGYGGSATNPWGILGGLAGGFASTYKATPAVATPRTGVTLGGGYAPAYVGGGYAPASAYGGGVTNGPGIASDDAARLATYAPNPADPSTW